MSSQTAIVVLLRSANYAECSQQSGVDVKAIEANNALTALAAMTYNRGMGILRRAYNGFRSKQITQGFVLVWLIFCATSCGSSVALWTDGEVPFVRSTPEVIDRMLELARIKPDDVVYDIGSGDGAIIISAAKKYGVHGIGIEIDQDLVLKARDRAFREKVDHLVEFRAQDAFTVDVSPATVVTLYMLPEFNAKMRPILERQLKPGTRVVSHDYPIEGWVPDRSEIVKGGFVHDHTVMLFEIR